MLCGLHSLKIYFTLQLRTNLCLSSFQGKLSNVNSLQSSFSTTTTFNHHSVSNWLILSDTLPIRGFLKACWRPTGKLFKLEWQFLFMWLNLVKSTKLPMYPKEESSHHVIQNFFFFFFFWWFLFGWFFWWFFFLFFFFQKMRAHVCNPRPTPHGVSWVPIAQ